MKKMSTGTGTLLLVGFFFILFGIILKFSGLNLLEPVVYQITSYFTVANTCFLVALIVHLFDKPS
jgi:hypothetical protein